MKYLLLLAIAVFTNSAVADEVDQYPGFSRDIIFADRIDNIRKLQEQLVERLIKTCMAERGFEYVEVPADPFLSCSKAKSEN